MSSKRGGIIGATIAIAASLAANSLAEPPNLDPVRGAIEEMVGVQKTEELAARVVDADGKPVAKAKVTPWALQSSQGHGSWPKGDTRADMGPEDAFTDAAGTATVLYPHYRDRRERIRRRLPLRGPRISEWDSARNRRGARGRRRLARMPSAGP